MTFQRKEIFIVLFKTNKNDVERRNKMYSIEIIWGIIATLIAIKAIVIGSDFNFYYWIKEGKKYTTWYNNRPTYRKEK